MCLLLYNALFFIFRYRFFGQDAEIVSKIFDIYCHQDRMFLTASVPTFNGYAHYVRKLVVKGYKVGIIGQTETAAEKKSSAGKFHLNNRSGKKAPNGKSIFSLLEILLFYVFVFTGSKSGTFSRALTAVYTKSTFMGENINLGMSESLEDKDNVKSLLMAVFESKTRISVMAVQPSSGQILWDEFEDDRARSELEQRLQFIQPIEMILSKELTKRWNGIYELPLI